MMKRFVRPAALSALIVAIPGFVLAQDRLAPNALPHADRPFGSLREQAAIQHACLTKRLDTFLPALLRRHGIDLGVIPMREYNEDPAFLPLTSPEPIAAIPPPTY